MQNMNTPTNRCQHRAGNSQRLDVLRAWKKEKPDRAEVKPSRCNINGRHSGRASWASPGEREPESSNRRHSSIHVGRGLLGAERARLAGTTLRMG